MLKERSDRACIRAVSIFVIYIGDSASDDSPLLHPPFVIIANKVQHYSKSDECGGAIESTLRIECEWHFFHEIIKTLNYINCSNSKFISMKMSA